MRFKLFSNENQSYLLNGIASRNFFRYWKEEFDYQLKGVVDETRRRCRVKFAENKYEYGWVIKTETFDQYNDDLMGYARVEMDREVKKKWFDSTSLVKTININLKFVEILNSDGSIIDKFQNQIISFK
jgi:hypothetical protein